MYVLYIYTYTTYSYNPVHHFFIRCKGTIERSNASTFVSTGVARRTQPHVVEITELPVQYKIPVQRTNEGKEGRKKEPAQYTIPAWK